MLVDLVSTTTQDGVRLDGALLDPNSDASSPLAVDAVLCLPGVGGNFYSSRLQTSLTAPWRELGLSVLWANTRGHDGMNTAITTGRKKRQGAAYEIVDDCRYDVAAWLDLLNDRGLSRVIVFGHSLGAIKAVYALAHDPHQAAVGLIAASPPRLSYKLFREKEDQGLFLASITEAEQHAANDRPLQLMEARFPFPLVITAQSYIDKYGPGQRYDLLRFVGDLTTPSLFTYGELELPGIAFAELPEKLAQIESTDSLTVKTLDGADHFYSHRHDALSQVTNDWMSDTF